MSNSDNANGPPPVSCEPEVGDRELIVTGHNDPHIAALSPDTSNSLDSMPFPIPLTEGTYHLTQNTPEIRWRDFAAYPSPLPSRDSSSEDAVSNASSGKSKREKAKGMARAKKELLMVKHWFGKSKRSSPTESSSEGRRRPMSMILDSAKVLAEARPHEV